MKTKEEIEQEIKRADTARNNAPKDAGVVIMGLELYIAALRWVLGVSNPQ